MQGFPAAPVHYERQAWLQPANSCSCMRFSGTYVSYHWSSSFRAECVVQYKLTAASFEEEDQDQDPEEEEAIDEPVYLHVGFGLVVVAFKREGLGDSCIN